MIRNPSNKQQLILLLLAVIILPGVMAQTPYFNGLRVKDIDQSISWYSNVFDLELHNRVESQERGFIQVNLRNENMLIVLVQLQESVSAEDALKAFSKKARLTGVYKIGYRVDGIDAWHKKLEALKVEFYGSVVTDVVSGKKTFLVNDPDGNIIQFFEK